VCRHRQDRIEIVRSGGSQSALPIPADVDRRLLPVPLISSELAGGLYRALMLDAQTPLADAACRKLASLALDVREHRTITTLVLRLNWLTAAHFQAGSILESSVMIFMRRLPSRLGRRRIIRMRAGDATADTHDLGSGAGA
jgi:hypothetical protein